MDTKMQGAERRFVIFRLAGEDYAVPIEGVHTVEKTPPITRVPHAPQFVDGVINLRGEIIPIVNLRRRLDLSQANNDSDTHVIVALAGEQLVGLLVDEISHVLNLPVSSTQSAEEVVGEINRNFIKSVGKWEDKLVIILDLERLVDPER